MRGRDKAVKPRLLFLDDEQWRHKKADERYGGDFDVFHCWTVNQLRSALELGEKPFSVISLDHDLGNSLTGMHAVNAVIELPAWKRPATVIVHTWNAPAGDAMVARLRSSGIEPVRKMFSAR